MVIHYLLTDPFVLNVLCAILVATPVVVWVVAIRVSYRKKKVVRKNHCPKCGSFLHPIRSQRLKICGSCHYEEPWELDPGQKPLIRNNRAK